MPFSFVFILRNHLTGWHKDNFISASCSKPIRESDALENSKKPAWQAKKNLLYEFLGATKNPSGQLKLRGKVEVDRLELKRKLTLPRESLCRKGFQKPS